MLNDQKTLALMEALFDITWTAVDLIRCKRIEPEDSRVLFDTCLALAQEFEKEYCEDDFYDRDYCTTVMEFAEAKLLAAYRKE